MAALINSYTRLWLIENGRQIYLPHVDVFRVMWHGQQDERVILHGYLPGGASLLSVRNGVTLEVVFSTCGKPSVYSDGKVIARFTNCRIKRKWINRPVISSPDYAAHLDCHVEFSCNIETFFEEMDV